MYYLIQQCFCWCLHWLILSLTWYHHCLLAHFMGCLLPATILILSLLWLTISRCSWTVGLKCIIYIWLNITECVSSAVIIPDDTSRFATIIGTFFCWFSSWWFWRSSINLAIRSLFPTVSTETLFFYVLELPFIDKVLEKML